MSDELDLPASFHDVVARSAVMNMGFVEEAARRARALSPELRRVLRADLELLAKMPGTLAGVTRALTLLAAQAAAFPAERAGRSGAPPGLAALHYAGMCLLHGLVAQAVREDGDAVKLLRLLWRSKIVDERRDRALLAREIELAVDP